MRGVHGERSTRADFSLLQKAEWLHKRGLLTPEDGRAAEGLELGVSLVSDSLRM